MAAIPDPASSTCSRCGADFECSVLAGAEQCWCMEESVLPPLPVPTEDARCLCPACLQTVRAQRAGVFTPF
jgi:hypothetical protein